MLQRKTTCRTSEANLDHVSREPSSSRRELVGLVGGHHNSVIEKDGTWLYCTSFRDFRPRVEMCDECPLRTERDGPA
jgi:hypothetical protein